MFYLDDLSHYVSGTMQKYVVVRPSMPTIWLFQEGTNLIQKEVITLKEVGFSFDNSDVWSLFGSQSSNPNSLHVLVMNAQNIVYVATPLWRKCEVATHTPENGKFGVLRDSQKFRRRLQGSKHLALRCSLYRWKGLEV